MSFARSWSSLGCLATLLLGSGLAGAAAPVAGFHDVNRRAKKMTFVLQRSDAAADTNQPVEAPADDEPGGSDLPYDEPDSVADDAQPSAASPRAGSPVGRESRLVRLHLMDGSVISGELSTPELEIETSYGSLTVPVTSVVRLVPGLTSHPDVKERLESLVRELGSGSFAEREAAQKELLAMGLPMRPLLQPFANDADTERRARVRAILEEFEAAAEADEESGEEADAEWRPLDLLTTVEFTIAGRVVPKEFDVASSYGRLTVKLSDIRRVERDVAQPEAVAKTVRVDQTHFPNRPPLSTGIRLERGDEVILKADGTLTLTPWGGNQAATPDGSPNIGWFMPNQIPNGALMGRVGNSGVYFKVGRELRFKADRAGVLQLAIGMDANFVDQQFPGQFEVKIRVQRKSN